MTRRTLAHVAAAALSAGTLVVGAAGLAGGQPNPPGNNGTVKIDGGDFDDHPDNEPHVGCTFQVDFYGYDEGDLNATVTFTGVPPTGGGELLSDEVFIGEDPGGGGNDHDASATYDLTEELSGITPHPEQGWHVRLDVNAEGSQGSDTKHKVFWVTGCDSGTTTTSTSTTAPTSTTSTTAPTSTTATTAPTSTTAPAPSPSTTAPTSTTAGPGVATTAGPGATTSTTAPVTPGGAAPAPPAGPGVTSPAPAGELARTGGETLPLALVAAGLIGLGATALSEQRRRRAAVLGRSG